MVEPSVADWVVRTGGGTVIARSPGWSVTRPPARTVDATVHERFTTEPVLVMAPGALVRVAGARLEVPSGCPWPPRDDGTDHGDRARIVLPDGSVSAESTMGQVNPGPPGRRRPRTRPAVPTCPLLSPWSLYGNYFHWICDVLVSLHSVLDRLPSDTRFVVGPRPRPFQLDSLAALGVAPDRVDEFAPPTGLHRFRPWRLPDLWFATLGRVVADDVATFRTTVLDALGVADGTGPRRIYVSRSDARYRRLANEDEVVARLAAEGFEVVRPGELTFAEQVRRFAAAEVVVGPHGAGLTNAVFSPPGVVVVDLQTSEVDDCFHALSAVAGYRYWYTVADDRPSGSSYRSDLHLPLDRLDALLAATLAG